VKSVKRVEEISKLKLTPGDDVCVIEEFLPGVGAYEHKGLVKSAVVGTPKLDLNLRVVYVTPLSKKPSMPEAGSLVYGVVVLVKDEYAVVKIVCDAKGTRYSTPFTGVIHITQVSDKYVKSLYELLGLGDVVKAKVLNDSIPYNLTIKEARLGIVATSCRVCGGKLVKTGEGLKCSECGTVDKRRVSSEYGHIKCVI